MSEKPPCECIEKIDGHWTYRCECSNGGDAEYAASWVADENAQDKIARLRAENEKLRAALERLLRAKNEKDAHGDTPVYQALKAGAWDEARAALEGK